MAASDGRRFPSEQAVGQPEPRRSRASGQLERALTHVASAVLFAVMALTFTDVLGRYLFSAPVKGAYELTEMAMGVVVFIGFPLACWQDANIRVTLFDAAFSRLLGERGRGRMEALFQAGAALICGFLALRLWDMAGLLARSGERSQHLGISLAPIGYFMFAGAVAAALACAARALAQATGRGAPRTEVGT